MKHSSPHQTTSQSLTRNPRILRLILIFGGLVGIGVGLMVNQWIPEVYCPPAIYIGVSVFAILVGLSSMLFPAINRQIGEFSFFSFVFFYLGIIFLTYTNQLIPGFVVLLLFGQLLFGISFRNLSEFIIFAIASLTLFGVSSFFAEELTLQHYVFLGLVCVVTLFSGMYIWLRETSFFQFRQNRILQRDLLDSSIFAIFLLDAKCEHVIYQNKIADGYMLKLLGNTHVESDRLFKFLGLDVEFIIKRFQLVEPDFQEKSYFTIQPRKEDEREFEIYISKIQTQDEVNILIKFRDITQIKQQERKLSRSLSVNESLLNAFPDILITFDGKGMIHSVRASQDFPMLQPIEQFVGRHFSTLSSKVMSTTKQKESEVLIEQARETHSVVQTEFLTIVENKSRHFDLRLVNLPRENEMLAIIRDITESKEVELALKQSEQNYREIFNAGTDGIIILQPETLEQIDVNLIACELLGYSRSELMGFTISALCDNPGPSGFEEFINQAIKGISHILECTLIRKDGSSLQTELTAKLAILGAEFRLILLIRDVRERKSAEERLRLFRSLINQSTDSIFVLDADTGKIFDYNQQTLLTLGYSPAEMDQLHLFDFEKSMDKAPFSESILEEMKKCGAYIYESRHKRKDGVYFPVEVNMGYVKMGRKTFLVGVARDISERLTQEDALRQSEQKYRTLVEKMNEGLILTDNDETILFVNNRLCEILGRPREELLGRRTYEVIEGEENGALIKEKNKLRREGISDQYEIQFKDKNGYPIWVLIAGAPYIDSNGDSIGTIAIITDITARKATELKLKEKNHELDSFVYKASHDLKGPLASIIGVTNIGRDEVTDTTAHRYFDLISKSTKRLDLILSELIDVTRINKAKLNLEPVNIQDMVNDIIGSLSHLPNSKKIRFDTDIYLSNGFKSDKKLLTSILQNLIVNSINYHDPDTADPYVRVSAQEKYDMINFSVEDNGVGIPDKMKHKVFEMFYRGNTKSKGSGLGLYIVKNAVEKLHGSVELDSTSGEGTTFSFALPAKVEDA